LNRNIDGAAQDVQTAITQAGRQLPENMPSPPYFFKVNPADQPVLYLSLTSSTLPMSKVDYYAENLVAQSLSTVTGVAQVGVYGQSKFAVRAQMDPHAMATRQIGIDEVQQALSDGNRRGAGWCLRAIQVCRARPDGSACDGHQANRHRRSAAGSERR